MILQKNQQIEEPFMSLMIRELFATNGHAEEELKPIGNREFYTWMVLLSAAVLIYGAVFHFFAS